MKVQWLTPSESIGGTALGKSWTNSETGTKRQKRSVAASYIYDIDTVSSGIFLVGTGLNRHMEARTWSQQYGFSAFSLSTGKHQKYLHYPSTGTTTMPVHAFPGGGRGVTP